MGFYSSHLWANGAIVTSGRYSDTEIYIKVQAPNEGEMLVDIIMGEHEALCLIHAMASVLSKKDEEEYGAANLYRR
jgi:hypothetical protein